MEQREELFEQSPDSLTQAERDYIETYKSGPVLVPNYQVKWNSILQEETLGTILPDLAQGKISRRNLQEKKTRASRNFWRSSDTSARRRYRR